MGKTFIMLLEPASSVTDFALGVVAIGAALLVERKQRVHFHWRLSFIFIGFSAILGGVHHGFIDPDGATGAVSWAVISLSIAVAISFLLSATIASVLGEGRGRPLLVIRGVSLFAFFILVILGRASIPTLLITEGLAMTMVVLLWVHAWRLEQPGVALSWPPLGPAFWRRLCVAPRCTLRWVGSSIPTHFTIWRKCRGSSCCT